jgi:hypothetical protein
MAAPLANRAEQQSGQPGHTIIFDSERGRAALQG